MTNSDSSATKLGSDTGTAGERRDQVSILDMMRMMDAEVHKARAKINEAFKPLEKSIQEECGNRGHYWQPPYTERAIFRTHIKRKCGYCRLVERLETHYDKDDVNEDA